MYEKHLNYFAFLRSIKLYVARNYYLVNLNLNIYPLLHYLQTLIKILSKEYFIKKINDNYWPH